MSLVGLVKIQREQFRKAILESLRLIHYKFPSYVKNIVIKPNMCYYWDYSTGLTTDPKFVASLIGLLREQFSRKIKICVVESDASAMKCTYAFKMLGYEDLARKYGVSLVNLSEEKSEKVIVRVGKNPFKIKVPHIIKNADLRINVPKIKYSWRNIKITCALKNIFGCNPNPRKFAYHPRIEEAIVAVNKVMEFDLCILDGNIVSGIETRKLGLTMASADPVALDSVACSIAGVNPKFVKYLRLAERARIGKTTFIPKGVAVKYFKARYPRRRVTSKLMSKALDVVLALPFDTRLRII